MKKSLLLILCAAVLALAASPKVSKACSKAKGEKACSESLVELAERGKSGDTLSIELYGKTIEAIKKNKKFMKPVMVKVDTLLWEPCKKKEAATCLEACTARTDSSFLRADAPDSIACAEKPQRLVAKKVSVPMPSPMQVLMDSLNRDAFWSSPFELAKRWMLAADDTNLVRLDSAAAELVTADPSDFAIARKKFHYCNALGDTLNALLDSLNAPVRCPVIGSVTDPRDGRVYRVERFGEKIWMIDNLAFDIPDSSACYDGDSLNCEKYGRLYPFAFTRRRKKTSKAFPQETLPISRSRSLLAGISTRTGFARWRAKEPTSGPLPRKTLRADSCAISLRTRTLWKRPRSIRSSGFPFAACRNRLGARWIFVRHAIWKRGRRAFRFPKRCEIFSRVAESWK